MQMLVIYIASLQKDILLNQFHVLATDNKHALEQLKEEATFPYNVLGVREYPEKFKEHFVNKKFF